jgi:hypothetical protein
MAPPALRSTRARTKAASPPRPPSLQSEATEEAAGDSSDDYNERSRPEASDDPEDRNDDYNEHNCLKASDDSDDVAPSRALSKEEDFSPVKEVSSGTTKRASKVAITTSNTSRKVLRSTKSLREQHRDLLLDVYKSSSSGLTRNLPTLVQLRITPSENTFWISRWLTAIPGHKVIKEVLPTPIEHVKITPLGSMLDMPGHRFKFSVEYCDIETNWDPQLGGEVTRSMCSTRAKQGLMIQYHAIRRTWRVSVWNDVLPKETQKHLRLFPKFAPQRSRRYGIWHRVKAKNAKPANPLRYSGRFIVRRGLLGSKNKFDSSENPMDFDWYDMLEDDHGLVGSKEDDPVDKPDRSGKIGGPGELVVNDQRQGGGGSGARSELLSLQGDAIVAKEELFSDIAAHAGLLPEDLQQSFVDKLLRYATWGSSVETSASTSVPASRPIAASASSSRLSLFKETIAYMIIDHGFDSFMRIEMLANASLDEWRKFHDDIQAPFTADEILTFCHEMKERTNFK